jgi:membrane protein YqaA with SNARE-associated domain
LLTYLSLFLVALAAASFLPFYSELLLGALVTEGYNPFWLWFWATLGNTAGSVVNYLIATYLLHFQDRRWFPVSKKQLESAQRWFNRFGKWSLLFAWAPIGGDALTFAAGILKVRWPIFLALVATGKGLRYAVFIAILLP